MNTLVWLPVITYLKDLSYYINEWLNKKNCIPSKYHYFDDDYYILMIYYSTD